MKKQTKKPIKNSKSVFKLSKNYFKTKKAGELFIEENKEDLSERKEIFKIYKWKNWKELADRVFSQYIRLMNADIRWNCICITCGKLLNRRDIQNWHYVSRWNMKYRYSVLNCHPQCYGCNVILSWNYRNYKKYMDKLVGPKQEEIMWNDKEVVKYNQSWYEQNILYRFREIKQKLHEIKV